jgi:Tfp pilus assembly protein PilV
MNLKRVVVEGTRRRARARRQGAASGFSLIEVMFALTFLAVGILAVASMIPAGTRGVSESRTITSSLMAAQLKMEDLRGQTFNALAVGTFADTTSGFSRSWTVTDSVPTPGCKRIKVTASWSDKRGGQSTVLTSYVTR